jgi:hypothetical protein
MKPPNEQEHFYSLGISCPKCGGGDTQSYGESYGRGDALRIDRKCHTCKMQWTDCYAIIAFIDPEGNIVDSEEE